MPLSAEDIARFESMEQAHPPQPPVTATSTIQDCEKTWVAVELLRADGQPFAGADYVINLPDGTQRTGKLDQHGYAIEKGIDKPGLCEVTFPDIGPVRPR